jgi:hypothetical protein
MTGVSGITTRSIRLIRTLIEIIVLAAGWLLGGSVGIGTVLYALTVGTITQFLLPRFAYRGNDAQRERTVRAGVTQRDARRYGTALRRPPRPELGRHAQGSPGDE